MFYVKMVKSTSIFSAITRVKARNMVKWPFYTKWKYANTVKQSANTIYTYQVADIKCTVEFNYFHQRELFESCLYMKMIETTSNISAISE